MGAEPEGGSRSDLREQRTSELRGKEEKKAILSQYPPPRVSVLADYRWTLLRLAGRARAAGGSVRLGASGCLR